ncbi:hypothetical protein VNO77_23202 [Canavalia gladiata]|uniref:Uncharacterized protein n=1 Tax=Canavalia gladiata TaxID=3824 RepID=A0AAN9QBI4_CANGL
MPLGHARGQDFSIFHFYLRHTGGVAIIGLCKSSSTIAHTRDFKESHEATVVLFDPKFIDSKWQSLNSPGTLVSAANGFRLVQQPKCRDKGRSHGHDLRAVS